MMTVNRYVVSVDGSMFLVYSDNEKTRTFDLIPESDLNDSGKCDPEIFSLVSLGYSDVILTSSRFDVVKNYVSRMRAEIINVQ